jgi:antitoxin VapB
VSQNEFNTKRTRVAAWLREHDADAVLLGSIPNLYWLGVGGELRRVTTIAVGFVVTPERCFLLCPNDDADRVRQEEVRGLGIEIVPLLWLGPDALVERARALLPGTTRWKCDVAGMGFETDSTVDLLRRTLQDDEIERLRRLGQDAAAALEEVATECYRGILERDAAARLAAECVRRQIVPRVILSGADERLETYTRPLPKAGAAEHVLMLSLVGMRGGLHVALSRIVCLARPEERFVERFHATLETAARLVHHARRGETLGAVVRAAMPQPALHLASLGGLAGYALPEVEARPSSNWKLEASQVVVWSIAAPGTRCEDTYLLGESHLELITATEGWPRRTVHVDGSAYDLPDLLLL